MPSQNCVEHNAEDKLGTMQFDECMLGHARGLAAAAARRRHPAVVALQRRAES